MEREEAEIARKRKITEIEDNRNEDTGETNEGTGEEEEEEGGMDFTGSEEMKLGIAGIHERVEKFNQLVSEMLESGKAIFNRLNQEFEERVLMIHREQIEKWQEDIKELRMIDTTNEEMNARLENVKCLLHTVHFNQ